ncbi:uncharacterized protein LOC119069124 [Bradysia coprophila]|uniref:uncharacterized protein LOC119069124 n=1 Tax=Bradysia coprophila TaxID=38358 RepID=UPI00187DB5E0|nr:uncharacterized protein LOC119069124 [Bradysia coprophila]
MISLNTRHLLIIVSVLLIGNRAVHCSDNCALYNSLNWDNYDSNFNEISGFYSVTKSNHLDVFGVCEVHGLTQQPNGDIEDRFVKYGSACSSVYKNRITKTSAAFQFAFFNDDANCMPAAQYRATDNMKMKVAAGGSCFFKSFCLPDGTSVVNLLCKKLSALELVAVLLSSVIQLVLNLLTSTGNALSDVPTSCYNEIIGDPSSRALLLP